MSRLLRITLWTALGCAAMLTAACSTTAATGRTSTDETTIRRSEASWFKAISARQLESTLSYYDDQAVLLAPNAPIARTPEAIRRQWVELFKAPGTVSGETTRVVIAESGDFAYSTGTYEFADPAIDSGKYVDIWRKQHDGSWRAVVDVFNSDRPLQSSDR